MCGIPAIYVRLIQMEILKLASFNRVLLCTWHVFTPKPPICSLHLHCSISNSKNSDLPGPLRCLFVCGWLARAVAYHKKDLNAVHNVGFWFSQFYFCTLKKSSFLARCSFSTAWNAGHEEQDTAFITRVENAIALHSYVFFFLAVAKWVQDILPPLPETNPLLLICYWVVWKRAKPSLCLMTVFDKLTAGIPDSRVASDRTQLSCSVACPPWLPASSATPWTGDEVGICSVVLWLHCTTNYLLSFYSHTSPFLILQVAMLRRLDLA